MVPGISSNSKKADCQAIFEKMLTGVSAAISGADRIVGIGGLETGLTFDYGQAVLDDEMVCLIKHMAQDIEDGNSFVKQLAYQPKLLVTAISLNIFVPSEF
jgi:trimethylamine:corrinoid methyltransferase-like protein